MVYANHGYTRAANEENRLSVINRCNIIMIPNKLTTVNASYIPAAWQCIHQMYLHMHTVLRNEILYISLPYITFRRDLVKKI